MDLISRLFRRGGAIPSDCLEFRENASDLLDDDCEEGLASRLRAHVRDCDDCSPWYRALRATVGLLGELPGIPAPSGMPDAGETVARIHKSTSE